MTTTKSFDTFLGERVAEGEAAARLSGQLDGLVIGTAPIVNTAANLASSNPTPAVGQVAYATDVDVVKFGDGVRAYNDLPSFEPAGLRELDVAESSVQQTGITAITDLTGLQIDFTVGDRPVYLDLFSPWIAAAGASLSGAASITDLANGLLPGNQGGAATFNVVAATFASSCVVMARIVTPGEYSLKGRIQRVAGTGTITHGINLGAYTARLRAYEL